MGTSDYFCDVPVNYLDRGMVKVDTFNEVVERTFDAGEIVHPADAAKTEVRRTIDVNSWWGDTPLVGVVLTDWSPKHHSEAIALSPTAARMLAEALLRAADESEGQEIIFV